MIEQMLKKYYRDLDYVEGTNCPEPEEIAAYCEGKLYGEQKKNFENHLLTCDSCLEIVVAASVPLPEEAVPSLLDRAADMVISFVGNLVHVLPASNDFELLPGMAMATSGLRGEQAFQGEKISFRKTFNGLVALMEVTRLKRSGGLIRVHLSRRNVPFPEKLRVSLSQNHKEISSYLTKDGEVVFEYFGYGFYTLNFTHQKTDLGEVTIRIEEET